MSIEGGWSLYRGLPRSPGGGGDRPPCRARGPGPAVARGRPRGGDRLPFFSDIVANLKKKKLHLDLVALWGATGGYF